VWPKHGCSSSSPPFNNKKSFSGLEKDGRTAYIAIWSMITFVLTSALIQFQQKTGPAYPGRFVFYHSGIGSDDHVSPSLSIKNHYGKK
jgi:hypothetical protein